MFGAFSPACFWLLDPHKMMTNQQHVTGETRRLTPILLEISWIMPSTV
jgi:hypothetical protein